MNLSIMMEVENHSFIYLKRFYLFDEGGHDHSKWHAPHKHKHGGGLLHGLIKIKKKVLGLGLLGGLAHGLFHLG